jgi:thiamine biosynthesis lipoprotein
MDEKQKKRLLWQVPFLTLLIIGTVLIIRQQHNMPYQRYSDFVFGTTFTVTYQCDSDMSQSIKAELMKVDYSLSPFNKESVITAINNNEDVKPDKMFMDVFQLAMDVSRETDGAFDITVAPLVNAWGFGFKSGEKPTARQVDSLRQIIGYQKITVDHGKIRKQDPRMMLDCSAIAKGYGTDVVANFLRQRGVKNFMVEIGGEVVTQGISEKRVPWRIGVTKPTDDSLSVDNELQTVLNVTNKAMATSGNYRNFYYKDGKKYAHTIDPKTGYPVQHSLLSATVLADNCATADAYATSFMVMGIEKAKGVLERHPELMAYFIYTDESGNLAVWYSPSMKDKILE